MLIPESFDLESNIVAIELSLSIELSIEFVSSALSTWVRAMLRVSNDLDTDCRICNKMMEVAVCPRSLSDDSERAQLQNKINPHL